MDESRKLFQSWFEEWFGEPPLTPWDELWCGDGYSAEDIDHMWDAWKGSRAAIEIDAEKLKIELENLECAQICLDEAGVPRKEGIEELSMWGRIVRYAAGIKVKE